MSFVEATLMRAREPPLGERSDPVHTREHDVRGQPTALDVDRLVDVAVVDGRRVARPGVGDERRSLFDVLGDETLERGRRRVGEHGHAAPPESSGLSALDSHAYQDLLAPLSATTKPGLLATEVGLVDFDGAGEPVAPGTDEHRAEPVQHRPGRLVGAELKGPLQALRRDPILRRRELPAHREPHREWRPAPVEQRVCRHGRVPVAAGALAAPPGHDPATRVLAPRADEALRPAQPREVVEAVGIGSEPRLELSGRAWVVHSTLGAVDHPSRLVDSDGYPVPAFGVMPVREHPWASVGSTPPTRPPSLCWRGAERLDRAAPTLRRCVTSATEGTLRGPRALGASGAPRAIRDGRRAPRTAP